MRGALVLGLLLWPVLASAVMIEGRVVDETEPVAGIRIGAYQSLALRGEPLAWSAPTDDEGLFRLDLPAGSYALAGWNGDRSRFALCGRNPVHLAEQAQPLWVGLQLVPVEKPTTAAYEDDYSAAIEGQVWHAGKPLAGAHVHLYLDVRDEFKGQGYRLSLPTGPDGYFRFDGLPESDYFLVARHRQDGGRVGPVMAGDLFGLLPDNPLTARAGRVYQVRLHLVEKLKSSQEHELFGRPAGPLLKGTVIDEAGQPVAGVHVFAYTDRVIGHQRPAAISAPTGPDGRFFVNLPAAGTYYVGARQAYGDSPAPGELFGMYDETADHGLSVDADEVRDGLKIMVEPIDIF